MEILKLAVAARLNEFFIECYSIFLRQNLSFPGTLTYVTIKYNKKIGA